jgi:hypothetical protein
MEDYKTITVKGFDIDGEPEIKVFEDGHIEILFNFMPPLNGKTAVEDEAFWDSFENVLATHLSVQVLRDDRELFIIPKTKKSTVKKLELYLESYWE